MAVDRGYASLAFPVIGGGSGGFDEEEALRVLVDALEGLDADLRVVVVRFPG